MVSIGYSALSSSLMVTGEANFRVREDVRITGIKVINPETAHGGYETYPAEYYKDGTKVMVTLPNLNSIITYQVEVTNNTKVDYYLKSKTDATNSNTSMQYTLSGAMNEQSPIKANAKSTFNIVISYKSGIALPSNKNLTLETRYVFDILDVTPPTVSFSPQGGGYTSFQTVRITASDEHYDHMDVEVRDGSNAKIDAKSKIGITTTTYDVVLDNYGTYKILVKAYDKRGNTQTNTPLENGYTYQQYVIKNPSAAEDLKAKVNPNNLTYTDSTAEQKRQMYPFTHEATEQTGALTDYRYIGNDPYNYVYFNCTDDMNTSTCETWRIIGIFSVEDENGKIEERMKIIRNESIGSMAWDKATSSDKYGVDNWKTASLNEYLNGTYLTSLSQTAQSMIGDTKYYLGESSEYADLGGPDYYRFERGTTTYNSRPISWVGKIALMYPSDYVYTYALEVNNKCYTDGFSCCSDRGGNPSLGWLFDNDERWTLAPFSTSSHDAFSVDPAGAVYSVDSSVSSAHEIYPTLYLTSSVSIFYGDGSQGNPYVIDPCFPPIISFNFFSGTYVTPRTITITVEDIDYSHMNVEVRNSNGKIVDKSQNNVSESTYTVTFEEEETYTISVTAYDENGHVAQSEQQYVIKEPKDAIEKLKSKINSNSSYASSTNAQKKEMFTFKHDATSQTGTLTDYRYIGNDPYNYVYFNCKKELQNSTNCETWRIIGIFSVDDGQGNIEERMKIIRDTSIGDIAWNTWDSDHSNNWKTASLNTYLNGTYLSSLSSTAQAMIGNTKYYLGGNDVASVNGETYYKFERGTTVYDTSRPTFWVGKIALMYPSDYVYTYALGVNDTCYNNGNDCNKGSPSSSWLFNRDYQWTLAPYSTQGDGVFYVDSTGVVNFYSVDSAWGVRPALYLVSSVGIIDGDGSSGNPYQLSI